MNCPRCTVELTAVASSANLCPQCEGLWVEKETLLALVTIPREALQASPLGGTLVADHKDISLAPKLNCPVCSGQMIRYVYCWDSGVTLDRCPEHGIWLDDGELSDILDYLAGLHPDAAPELAEMSQKNLNLLGLVKGWSGS